MKIRIAFLSCLLFNCSSDPDSASMANLRPIVGKLNVGTSEYATSSYGGASNDKTPDVISLGRKAIICDTPSRFAVKRDDPQATVFSTAVRSTTTPVKPLMFMVLNAENEKIEILHSLVVTDNKWHPIQIEIEDNCREVVLTASYELPSTASDPGPNVAWAIPDFSRPAHSEEADVLIISIDTLRSSSLTFAPFLSKLMASGRNYINAYSPSNWTLPAFASLASGLTPQQHLCGRNEFAATATNDNENRVFSALSEVPTLADAFSDASYGTAFIHQNPFLESWTNVHQGFDLYSRTADRVDSSHKLAIDWWRSNKHRSRLLLMHYMEPHWPYKDANDAISFFGKDINTFFIKDKTPQQRRDFFNVSENVINEIHKAYNQQIKLLDKQLEKLVSEASRSSNNLVIVIHVDHGEELWDHGSFEHGHSFADCVVKVPLAIIHDKQIAPEQINTPVPAHHIGNYLLEYLAIDNQLPPSALGSNPAADRSVSSTHPLYRCDIGGKKINPDGSYSIINNEQLKYGGAAAEVPEDVVNALLQLGYSDD